MQKPSEFNIDAAAALAATTQRMFDSQRGIAEQLVGTRQVIIQSRSLMAAIDVVMATGRFWERIR